MLYMLLFMFNTVFSLCKFILMHYQLPVLLVILGERLSLILKP
jgi:hypothetical protein